MENTKIKICGLFREVDIEYVNEVLPDYIGFVFWENSRRFVDAKKAEQLHFKLDKRILSVGVFVNESPEEIISLLKNDIIQVAQLHGDETEEMIVEIQEKSGKPVWKAIKVNQSKDAKSWMNSTANCLLLDNGYGTGKTFDWSEVPEMTRPYFVAGGIDSSNVKEAIQRFHPFGIDVSSSVETNGYKDPEKIAELVRRIRNE